MKHHFGPWSESTENLGGFAKLVIQPGDAHTKCTRCGVTVLYKKGQTTKKFWVGGKLTSKTPPCTDPS